jgi:hypothetical protein
MSSGLDQPVASAAALGLPGSQAAVAKRMSSKMDNDLPNVLASCLIYPGIVVAIIGQGWGGVKRLMGRPFSIEVFVIALASGEDFSGVCMQGKGYRCLLYSHVSASFSSFGHSTLLLTSH